MVLQRWQTVYLFLAAVLMIVFAFMTSITIQFGPQQYMLGAIYSGIAGETHPDMLLSVMDALIVVITIITIFKYKNLKSQMNLCAICIALTIAMLLCIMVLAFTQKSNGTVSVMHLGNVLPIVAIVLYALAYRGIAHDKKLLSDSERLR